MLDLSMTKTHFRILVVCEFLLVIMSGIIDSVFPNETIALLTEYVEALEADWSDTKTIFFGGYGLLALIWVLYTFIGLLWFWDSARLLYLLGFIVFMPIYFFAGINVSSAIGQALADTGNVLSGVILALIYFSPVKSYFVEKSTKGISLTTDNVS